MNTQDAWVSIFAMLFATLIVIAWINRSYDHKKARLEASRIEQFKAFEMARCKEPHADGSPCFPQLVGETYVCFSPPKKKKPPFVITEH